MLGLELDGLHGGRAHLGDLLDHRGELLGGRWVGLLEGLEVLHGVLREEDALFRVDAFAGADAALDVADEALQVCRVVVGLLDLGGEAEAHDGDLLGLVLHLGGGLLLGLAEEPAHDTRVVDLEGGLGEFGLVDVRAARKGLQSGVGFWICSGRLEVSPEPLGSMA